MPRTNGSRVYICVCGKWYVRKPGTRQSLCGRCRGVKADLKPEKVQPDEHNKLKCNNCFKPFQRNVSGQNIFCDACEPWFPESRIESGIDHEREQEQARKVTPVHGHMTARNIVEGWLKQG